MKSVRFHKVRWFVNSKKYTNLSESNQHYKFLSKSLNDFKIWQPFKNMYAAAGNIKFCSWKYLIWKLGFYTAGFVTTSAKCFKIDSEEFRFRFDKSGTLNDFKSASVVGIYLFKVSSRSTRARCEICSELAIKTQEGRQWRRSGVFIVNFEHTSHFILAMLLLIFGTFQLAKKSFEIHWQRDKRILLNWILSTTR